MRKGKIIAASGMPGCGKSSVTKELGKLLNIEIFNEPEEQSWSDAVKMREVSGNFTALMWFRSIRVPMLYKANSLRELGITSMIDSYYDKLFYLYHNKKGIEWLFDKSDYYYNEMIRISKKDYKHLPNVDILLFLKLNEVTWTKFIKKGIEIWIIILNLKNHFHYRMHFKRLLIDTVVILHVAL